jgi:hypothetical protein
MASPAGDFFDRSLSPSLDSLRLWNHLMASLHSVGSLVSSRLRLLRRGLGGLLLAYGLDCGLARGAEFDSWSKVEQAQETADYGQRLREGKFEAEQKAFVEQTLMPQLRLEANRATIATVRQRIRDVALRGATKPEVIEQGNAVIRDGMLEIVADQTAEPVVRVNAMLLVDELQSPDRGPWPGSLAPLAQAAADASLPLAVRVAALNGLARRVAAAGGAGPAVTAAAPVVAALVATPPEGDPVAVRWLVSRALELLPAVAAQPAAVAAAARILANDKADTDLRVRAAMAIGKLATPQAGIDAGAAIGQVKTLAISALAADLDAAAARRLDRKLAGGGGLNAGQGLGGGSPMPAPRAGRPGASGGGLFGGPSDGVLGAENSSETVVDEDAVPVLACRRNAWRLYGLAEAVKPARDGSGLAGLLQGDAAAAAAGVATTMRDAAVALDTTPDEESLAAALADIRKLAAAPGPATGEGNAGAAANPAQPASPFDQPASNSPF